MGGTTLITGGAGYIGMLLAEELLAASHDVRVLDSLLHDQSGCADALRDQGVEVLIGDVSRISFCAGPAVCWTWRPLSLRKARSGRCAPAAAVRAATADASAWPAGEGEGEGCRRARACAASRRSSAAGEDRGSAVRPSIRATAALPIVRCRPRTSPAGPAHELRSVALAG